jgi:hypothetical protein
MADELKAVYYETILPTVSTGITPANLTLPGAHPTRDKPKLARVTVEVASIYYLLNGEAPVADPTGKGHLLEAGDLMLIEGYRDITNFRCIESSGANGAKVKVTVYYP